VHWYKVLEKISKEKRSDIMKKVRREGTGPELRVRKYLFSKGLRYQVCRKDLPGSPDIVFSKKKMAIFVHGCFWHQHLGCRKATIPKSNSEFWITKFKKTKERDVSVKGKLNEMGWSVIIIWECEIDDATLEKLFEQLLSV